MRQHSEVCERGGRAVELKAGPLGGGVEKKEDGTEEQECRRSSS